jgi:rhodanese-related sulfurtransferase
VPATRSTVGRTAVQVRQEAQLRELALRGGLDAWRQTGGAIVSGSDSSPPLGLDTARKVARFIAPSELNLRLAESSPSVVDVGSSPEFEAGLLPGAKWVSRGWLEF